MDRIDRLYRDERAIALLPVLAIVVDYSLTFFLSGSPEMILKYDASPLLRFGVANNIVPLVVLVLAIFYYLASLFVMKLLVGSDLYPVGVTLIALVSLTHLLGGLSWYFRNNLYSDTVIGLSLISVMIAVLIFGYAVVRGRSRAPG